MINGLTVFSCTGCEAEFEVIAHSDFEDGDINFCPVCGDPAEADSNLMDFAQDEDGD